GRRAHNLAVPKGSAAADCLLLRRALRAGARPAAVLLDGDALDEDPLAPELFDVWPSLVDLRECVELGVAARDPAALGRLCLGRLLPSYRRRLDLRSAARAALADAGRPDTWLVFP